jgi:protein-disulfide isomerase
MRPALLIAVLVLAPCMGWAQPFTAAQRADIVRIMREALKSDPSILRDAVASLQADDEARDRADSGARLAAARPQLIADPGDAVAGNPHGDVTMVEFYDPRCPYCRKMLPEVQALIARDTNLRVVYKDIPVLGPASALESRAIVAAGRQGGYVRMQQALMTTPAPPNEALIRETAQELGLNADRLMADMNSAAVTGRIEANLRLARDLKVDGTPVFIIGDQMVPGAVDQDTLQAAVAAARKHS